MRNYLSSIMNLIRDSLILPSPLQLLSGERLFRPFQRYQLSWANYFYPEEDFLVEGNVWSYLQKFMLPLVMQNASDYHTRGIKLLNLDAPQFPDFTTFKKLFLRVSNGFEIVAVENEIDAMEYFKLISARKFPCVQRLREFDELFCGNEPDFWHEAIGHLAPLCFPEVQEFYVMIARHLLAVADAPNFENHLAVAWTLMEYGFVKQDHKYNMFGAALVGSHLANMRYQLGYIKLEPAISETILDSQFYLETTPAARDAEGNLRFFYMQNLQDPWQYFPTSTGH